MQLVEPDVLDNRRRKLKRPPPPIFFAEPVTPSNSFVGTEEYIAPVSQVTHFLVFFLFFIFYFTVQNVFEFFFLTGSFWGWLFFLGRKLSLDRVIVALWTGGLLVF
jgi:hypothetical protein